MQYKKFISELRYRPNPAFLDSRGRITSEIVDSYFNEWKITDNRIELKSSTNTNVKAVIDYKSVGIIVDLDDISLFKEKAEYIIKKFWHNIPTNSVYRMGVRITTLTSIPKTSNIKDLTMAFRNKLTSFGGKDALIFSDEFEDIGFSINFKTNDFKYNIYMGPMDKKQAENYFEIKNNTPDANIFLDLDFFQEDISSSNKNYKQKEILEIISLSVNKSEELNTKLKNFFK